MGTRKTNEFFKLSLGLIAVVPLAFVAADVGNSAPSQQSTPTTSASDHRVDFLEQQLATLKEQVEALQDQRGHLSAASEESAPTSSADYLKKSDILRDENITLAVQAHSLVSFGPYLNMNPAYDGSELIVNTSSIREPMRLLKRNYQTQQDALKAGKPLPNVPRIELSGNLGAQTLYQRNYQADSSSNIDLTDVEVDMYVVMNHWITGYIAYVYDNTPDGSSAKREDNSNVLINKAFITVGDFARTPVYATIGQYYVPFGRYSSWMIVPPLTQSVGRTKERAIEVGYKSMSPNNFYSELYVFGSSSGFASERSNINDGGIDLGYDFRINDLLQGEVGASLISTIADSNGIQHGGGGTGFEGLGNSSASEALDNRVPAMDIYASLTLQPVTLVAEYLRATRPFDRDSGFLYGQGQGARPSAFNAEVAYVFNAFDKPHSIAVGYGQTGEAVALGLPQRRYIVTYNVSLWEHTLESLEFRREYNYGESAGAYMNAATDSAFADLGRASNVITAKINVYF